MNFLFWLKGILGLIYVSLGLWLVFHPTNFAGIELDAITGYIFGALLLLYGLFRVYNQYVEYNNSRGEE